jgi:hypothetical protein
MNIQKTLLALFALCSIAAYAIPDASAQSRRHCSGRHGTIVPRWCLDNPQAWQARIQKWRQARARQSMQQSKQKY